MVQKRRREEFLSNFTCGNWHINSVQTHQEWNQTFWNWNPALLDPKFWVYFSMSSMLCWFWCCVKACPGSCRKHPDLWCFEFHWWKPAGCVMSRPTPSPRGMLSGILSPLSPVLLYHKNLITMLIRSQTRFQKQYIGCEFQGFPQPGFDVCRAVVRFSVSTCSDSQYLLELRCFKCQAGTELLPASSPDLGNITEAPCSGSMSLQGDFRHK